MGLAHRNVPPFLFEVVLIMHFWHINIRDRLRQKLGSVCETNSSKREKILCLKIIIIKKKVLGTWGTICLRYGNFQPFGYLTNLTFYLTNLTGIMFKYKSSWIYQKTNELVIF